MIVKYTVKTVEGVTFSSDCHATRIGDNGHAPTSQQLQRFIARLSSRTYKAGYIPTSIEVEVLK